MNQASWSPRRASLIAGVAILLIAVLAAFGNFVVVERLVTAGDAARTAHDILASQTLFRWGIASLILVTVLDIVAAVSLLALLEPVHRGVATMAAVFRIAFAAVFLVAITQLVSAASLLGQPDQALRAIDAFTLIWTVSLILFGVHLLLIGYLAYRSGFMPRILGILLAIAGLGYAVDGFGTVLAAGYSTIGQYTFIGEVVLIFWLLIKGVRLGTGRPVNDQAPSVQPSHAGPGV